MNKNFSTKLQKISPNLQMRERAFSSNVTITPETEDLIEKKGLIYAVFNISASSDVEVALTNRIISDVLKESYYHSDNISPIQSLEKAIVDVKDKIFKLTNDQNTVFDIVAIALWGNVIYYVQYGKGFGYLVREGNVKTINLNAEGKFSTASGIVRNDDVLIMCTDAFGQIYSPAKMLTTSISVQSLETNMSSLILKFQVETTFSTEEIIRFSPAKNIPIKRNLAKEKVTDKLDDWKAKFLEIVKVQVKKIYLKLPNKSAQEEKPKNYKLLIGLGVGILILILGAFFIFKPNEPTQKQEVVQKISEPEQEVEGAKTEKAPEPTIVVDADATIRDKSTALYDIKISDPTANPTKIAYVAGNLLAADTNTGTFYSSSVENPKFSKLEGTYKNINNMEGLTKTVRFTDDSGYHLLDVENNKITQSYDFKPTGIIANYLEFVYSVSGNDILRNTLASSGVTNVTWSTDEDFRDARSMTISVSIYLVTKDGKLVKYTKGEADSFALTGFQDAPKVVDKVSTDLDFDYLYVMDKAGKRIIQMDHTGKFNKQYRYSPTSDWNDLKDFAIDAKEKFLYVLDGSTVYQVSL